MSRVNKPIVSVHTPKVAGTSFLRQLQTVFHEANVLLDYGDDPADISSRLNVDPESYRIYPITSIAPYRVVHGHFHPIKYDALGDTFRLTFLRHPVDNVMSIFRFWSASPSGMWDSPLFRYFKENALTVERLAMLPIIRFLYARTYFGGYDMSRFDFIGDYSKYSNELLRLGDLLSVKFDTSLRLNVTQKLQSVDLLASPKTCSVLTDILIEDIKFYEQHVGK